MHVADLTRLYDYAYWANDRLFQVLGKLTPEQFTQQVAGAYGSIRNTLVHALSAEWGWMDRCGGPPRGPKLNPADYPTFEVLRQRWKQVEGQMRSFLAELVDQDLARNVEFKFGEGPVQSRTVGDLLLHGVVHGIHHRGQTALLLRTLGLTPGDFDFLYYAETAPPA